MNKLVRLLLVILLMIVAAPAFSAEVLQVFDCQVLDEATDDDIEAVSLEWLQAAKKIKGGERIEVHIRYPLVAKMGENDFSFIITIPSLEEWGLFTSGYEDSELEKIDDKMDKLCDCPDSSLWEIEKLE